MILEHFAAKEQEVYKLTTGNGRSRHVVKQDHVSIGPALGFEVVPVGNSAGAFRWNETYHVHVLPIVNSLSLPSLTDCIPPLER